MHTRIAKTHVMTGIGDQNKLDLYVHIRPCVMKHRQDKEYCNSFLELVEKQIINHA